MVAAYVEGLHWVLEYYYRCGPVTLPAPGRLLGFLPQRQRCIPRDEAIGRVMVGRRPRNSNCEFFGIRGFTQSPASSYFVTRI